MKQQFAIDDKGRKVRVGPVPKSEFCKAMNLSNMQLFSRLIHRNQAIMTRLLEMGYNKNSRTLTRSQARFLAEVLDVYIEGIFEGPEDISPVSNFNIDKS